APSSPVNGVQNSITFSSLSHPINPIANKATNNISITFFIQEASYCFFVSMFIKFFVNPTINCNTGMKELFTIFINAYNNIFMTYLHLIFLRLITKHIELPVDYVHILLVLPLQLY